MHLIFDFGQSLHSYRSFRHFQIDHFLFDNLLIMTPGIFGSLEEYLKLQPYSLLKASLLRWKELNLTRIGISLRFESNSSPQLHEYNDMDKPTKDIKSAVLNLETKNGGKLAFFT